MVNKKDKFMKKKEEIKYVH